MRFERSDWMTDRDLFCKASSNIIRVAVGEIKVSRDPTDVFEVTAIDCSVALLVHDPVRGIAGVLHYLLPIAELSKPDASERPALFADTGIPLLVDALGANSPRHLVWKAAGGASQQDADPFDVGRRNYAALRDQLKRLNVSLTGAALGGSAQRTVRFHVGAGRTFVTTGSSPLAFEI